LPAAADYDRSFLQQSGKKPAFLAGFFTAATAAK